MAHLLILGVLLLWTLFVQVTATMVHISDEAVLQARCEAFCRNEYMDSSEFHRIQHNEDINVPECNEGPCQKCLIPCRRKEVVNESCSDICKEEDACLSSCQFLGGINSSSLLTENITHETMSKPEIVCKNIPYKQDSCSQQKASIFIKWEVQKAVTSGIRMFVVSIRRRNGEYGKESHWSEAKIVPYTFIEVGGLSCDTFYQFAVTTVTVNGPLGASEATDWSKTLTVYKSQTPSPPLSMNIEEVFVEDQRPSALVSWETDEDASCYYRIFWMSKIMEEEEIKTPREFRYNIRHLEFSTNYSIYLYAYDDQFRRSSREVQQNVLTPDCLTSTMYNYSVCGPLPPDNLTINVLTRNHEDKSVKYVNLTLTWSPPPNTHKGVDVRRYYVEYRKEPLIRGAYLLEPDRGLLLVNSSETSVVIGRIHNHNHYSFSVIANTKGGNSTAVKLVQYIALHGSNESDIGLESSNSYLGSVTSSGTQVPISNELVAIVLSCAVLIIIPLVIVFVILLRRRNNGKEDASARRFGPIEEMNPIYERVSPLESLEFQHKIIPDDYEIDYSRLDFISVIGEGAFGKVVKAEYRPPSENGEIKPSQIVAVKMLKEFYTGDESRNFLLEIQAMKNLGHHPYIVSIIGSCMTGPKLCLVMDYCALGDLRNYLRKYREKMMYNIATPYGNMSKPEDGDLDIPLLQPSNPGSPISSETNRSSSSVNGDQIELTEGQLLSYARQITMGMEFLEERKFIHRDLAARNILLCDPRHLKISDFGLTRDVYETNVYQPTSARKLPYKWMAIESLFSQRFTIKSDVWSFGIVLWEIVTLGGSPYPSIPLKDLYGLLKDGYRMEKPDNCSPKLFKIMLACWHPNPNCRPAFSQLRVRLEKLLEETQSYIDLSIEVSNDYFNESTSGSHPPQYPNSQDDSQISSADLTGTPSEISHLASSKELYVDIHNGHMQETDANKPDSPVGGDSQSKVFEEPQIYPESSENCSFHMENNRLLSEGSVETTDSSKRCQCVLCVNKASMDNRHSQVYEYPSKPRGSLKSSLRNILEKVSMKTSDNISRQKKRSVSLSDVYAIESRHESQV